MMSEFRNQYLVTDSRRVPEFLQRAEQVPLGGWTVFAFAPLETTRLDRPDLQALLIGVAVDPLQPSLDRTQTLEAAFDGLPTTLEGITRGVRRLTGRFVLLVNVAGKVFVWGDACHLRQILYARLDGARCVASCERLLLTYGGVDLDMDPLKRRFMASPLFTRNESAWVGAEGWDNRVSRLLPNHALELDALRAFRLSMTREGLPAAEDDVTPYAVSMLKGTIDALSASYRLIQPVTAGWDSRMLLAASLPNKERISYYIFDRSNDGGRLPPDVAVAFQLRDELGFSFEHISPPAVDEAFSAVMANEVLFPRVLPKIANIQHHYRHRRNERVVNINGNAAEVARCYYGRESHAPSFRMVTHYLGYSPRDPYVLRSLAAWYEEAKRVSAAEKLPLSDLVYWEQRMGNWGAMMPREQDVAVEEISPFNNANLLLALLNIPATQRCAPDFHFFRRLVEAMSPAAAKVPVNPHVSRRQALVTRSALLTFVAKWSKHQAVTLLARR